MAICFLDCDCGKTCIKEGDMAGRFDKDCNCRFDWWKFDSLCSPISTPFFFYCEKLQINIYQNLTQRSPIFFVPY